MSTETLRCLDPDPSLSDKPWVEIWRGIEIPKVSPRRRHGYLQGLLFMVFYECLGNRGDIACEWRLRLSPPGDPLENTLLPDLAFIELDATEELDNEQLEEPQMPPTVAVEIRSPNDRPRNIATKIRMYLEAGTRLVLDVDPPSRRIYAHDAHGEQEFTDGMRFEHNAIPGLQFDVTWLFERAERRKREPPNKAPN